METPEQKEFREYDLKMQMCCGNWEHAYTCWNHERCSKKLHELREKAGFEPVKASV